MKYLKFVILLLILCNISGYSLVRYSAGLGIVLNYSISVFIIIYYALCKKERPNIHFIIFGTLFFLISVFVNAQFSGTFLITFVKYFIFIIMMSTVLRDVKNEDIYGILLIGCLSIIYEAIFVTRSGAPSSGLYLNANFAAYTCILGYSMGLAIKNQSLKIPGQILFTIAGLLTFSITFLIIWLLINLLSVFANTKNIVKLFVCLALLAVFISFGDRLRLNAQRMNVFSGVSGGTVEGKLKEGARTETWTLYYDKILKNPIWGNGYGQIAEGEDIHFTIQVDVHNTFLMIMGEAGIFALLYFLWIYGYITMNSLYFFEQNPSVFYVSFALIFYMLTSHKYFDDYLVLFTSLWLYQEVYKMKSIGWRKTRVIIRSPGKFKQPLEEELLSQYHLN